MDHTARLDLPYILSGQALKHVTHNEALERLDALVQPAVEAADRAAPPSAPLLGQAWLVPEAASGAWAGHGHEIAVWQAGDWRFYDPAPGWQVFDKARGTFCLFSGSRWVAVAAIGAGLPQLGINTEADAENRLAVAGPATLFTHMGGGHQLKINKAAQGDTASLVFQQNWTGHAEMGLMGDRSWRLKVSADGSAWIAALAVDAASGALTLAGALQPAADNAQALGSATARWSAIWSASGTIQTSDIRLKTDIAPSDLGLDFILALRPVRYRWRAAPDRPGAADTAVYYGLLAQEVQAVLSRCGAGGFAGHVLADPADPLSHQALRYDQFIAPLVGAIHDLAARLQALEAAGADKNARCYKAHRSWA